MRTANTIYLSLFFLFSGTNILSAQETQTAVDSTQIQTTKNKNIINRLIDYFDDSNKVKEEKDFDVSFIGGPHYSSDTKLGLGLVASGLYRIDKENLELSPSNISLYSNFTTSGFYSFGIEGNTIFPEDKWRIDFETFFSSMPSRYWGVGYDKGKNKDDYTKYTRKEFHLKFDVLRRLAKYTYVGVTGTAQHIRGSSFDDISYLDPQENRNNTAIGAGYIVSYDSRDFIPNPFKGMYFKLEQNFYPAFMGSTQSFNRIELTARYYQRVWKDGILAFDFNTLFNNGDVPWNMLASLGGSRQMRGYYAGQYRDKKMMDTQVELRQRVYKRGGIVVWAGAGNTFRSLSDFELNQTLPTVGLGYRWEFKNRVNIRLDYGIGKGQSGFYFNINEAF